MLTLNISPLVPCSRCGIECRVAPKPESRALMLRAAEIPQGHCVNCAITHWLMCCYPLNTILDEKGPESLLRPGETERIAPILAVFHADASPDEIDWERVVANWELPLPPIEPTATNPYQPWHPKRAPRPWYDYPPGEEPPPEAYARPEVEPVAKPKRERSERQPRKKSTDQGELF